MLGVIQVAADLAPGCAGMTAAAQALYITQPTLSARLQTLEDEVLRAIGRRHSAQDILDAYALAREVGFDSINMDLIAGLPA